MGMTSEEPITHLRWFEELLRAHGVEDPAAQVMVMTLPGSFLDHFAQEREAPRLDIQLDGRSHIAGRMSAPSTRVFLLPAALGLPGRLQEVLSRCQTETAMRPGMPENERRRLVETDPFVSLAAWLSVQVDHGRDMLVLDLPRRWAALAPWVEQVVEESLGKEDRGLLVFYDQDVGSASSWPDRFCILQVDEGSGSNLAGRPRAVLHLDSTDDSVSRIAACARCFAGWNLTVALVAYLQDITFAGQPAVEHYKAYARGLRDAAGELPYPTEDVASTATGRLKLFSGAAPVPAMDGRPRDAASILAAVATSLEDSGRLGYFDLTVNGDSAGPLWEAAQRAGRRFGNRVLGRPTKVRAGPRDYHSTEQSETAGPPDLLSLQGACARSRGRDGGPVRCPLPPCPGPRNDLRNAGCGAAGPPRDGAPGGSRGGTGRAARRGNRVLDEPLHKKLEPRRHISIRLGPPDWQTSRRDHGAIVPNRELGRQAEHIHDVFRDHFWGRTDIDPDRRFVRRRLLEVGELTVQQARRHEVVTASSHAPADRLIGAGQEDEDDAPAWAVDQVPVRALQGRTSDDPALPLIKSFVHPIGDSNQPPRAIVVSQRMPRAHLLDVRWRVQGVAFFEQPA